MSGVEADLHDAGGDFWPGHSLQLPLRQAQLVCGEVPYACCSLEVHKEVSQVVQPVTREDGQVHPHADVPEGEALLPRMHVQRNLQDWCSVWMLHLQI